MDNKILQSSALPAQQQTTQTDDKIVDKLNPLISSIAPNDFSYYRRSRTHHDQNGTYCANQCLICGDNSCSHHYYGVPACHGCKCFFWRSVKNQLKYVCRGRGKCEINSYQRSNCRYCRYKRCIESGMKPEAVRITPTKLPISINDGNESNSVNCSNDVKNLGDLATIQFQTLPSASPEIKRRRMEKAFAKLSSTSIPSISSSSRLTNKINGSMTTMSKVTEKSLADSTIGEFTETLELKSDNSSFLLWGCNNELEKKKLVAIFESSEQHQGQKLDQLVQRIAQIERATEDVADFCENEAPKRQLNLTDLFNYPELLDRFRTQVNFCVRLRRVSVEEMEFCKYRTLTKASDYIRLLTESIDFGELFPIDRRKYNRLNKSDEVENSCFTIQDKIVLLRNGFASMTLFDIVAGTTKTTKDPNLLLLPTGITLSQNEQMVSNSFLNQKLLNDCANTLVRMVVELNLDSAEYMILKGIVTLNNSDGYDDTCRISNWAQTKVDLLRDLLYAALYHHCEQNCKWKLNKPDIGSSTTKDATISSRISLVSDKNSNDPCSATVLRFVKLVQVIPKISLLARDLIEQHIRMAQTFVKPSSHMLLSPSCSSIAEEYGGTNNCLDSLFFDLFGDIFQKQQGEQQEHLRGPILTNDEHKGATLNNRFEMNSSEVACSSLTLSIPRQL